MLRVGIHDRIEQWVTSWGVPPAHADLVALAVGLGGLAALSLATNYIARHFIIRAVTALIRRTETKWDDRLIDRHVFDRLSQLVPGMLLFVAAPILLSRWPWAQTLSERGALVYMGVVSLFALDGVLNAVVDVYESFEATRFTPIKSYVQVVKIVTYVIGLILLISAVVDRSPIVLLSGLGALSAVLLLVFKDSILGLVASVQISAMDMVRKGDWIEVPKYGADGDVIDIALTTIKVQNWDKTISTIPAYSLISESFRNWRGMQEAGGRRIKRALSLDVGSVRFSTPEELDRFERITLIRDYVRSRRAEIERFNAEQKVDPAERVNGRRMTNLGTFRAYIEAYLRASPNVHQGLTLMVRQLPPSEHGIAIEIYCFTKVTAWARYEAIQADIFDHLLAVAPEFGLRVFQAPTGSDFRALASA